MTTSTLKAVIKEAVRGVPSRVPQEESTDLVAVINIKDLVDGAIDTSSLEEREVSATQKKEEKTVRTGDVVVTIRGTQFRAAVVDSRAEGTFASANLAVLRVDGSKMRPEILAAYLNSPHGQHQLTSKARGATMPSIAMKDLLSITVPLLPLKKQDQMKEYLVATADYLATLRREEEQVAQIRDHLIIRYCGVSP